MTTNVQGFENEMTGLESGADDFITKPLRPSLVRVRVKTMLRHKALIDSLADDFDPDSYHDQYREELLQLIERKAKGTRNCYSLNSDRIGALESACSGLFAGLVVDPAAASLVAEPA